MRKTRNMWTPEEEDALVAGVERYGVGRWKVILDDPAFVDILCNRSNVDLKDKWRNMNASIDVDDPQSSSTDQAQAGYINIRRMVRATRKVIITITIIALLAMWLAFAIHTFWTLPFILKFLWLRMCFLIPKKLLNMCKSFIKCLRKLRRFYKWIKNVKC